MSKMTLLTVFNEMEKFLDSVSHLVSLSLCKLQMQRGVDTKAQVLELIKNLFLLAYSLTLDTFLLH